MEDYKFHANKIIETLEMLYQDFRNKKIDVNKEEVSRVTAHDSVIQSEKDYIKMSTNNLDNNQKKRAQTIEEIEDSNQQLTTVSAALLEDQQYLKELSNMCRESALTWDQRSKIRSDELTMLTNVISIVKGDIAGNTTAATIRFAQVGANVYIADAVAKNDDAMNAIEAAAEAEGGDVSALSFLQRHVNKPKTSFLAARAETTSLAGNSPDSIMGLDRGRQVILTLLQSKGRQLQSSLLLSLAGRIAADPFSKVKQLIQELIERLLQEAGNEANQKGWCDKATSDAEQKRSYSAKEVQDLNDKIAKLEAKIDKLSEEVDVLGTDIDDLEEERKKAVSIRESESEENAKAVTEAKMGGRAVSEAMTILSRFYLTAAKSRANLSLAQGPSDDAPDTGFKIGEAYVGAQGDGTGIIGMLDVIRADFARTVKETNRAELEAHKEHLAYMTQSGKLLQQKEEEEHAKFTWKSEAMDALQGASEALDEHASILEGSVEELIQLKATCIDTGMSYADRVTRREDEMAALKKALCILNAYARYGPDGATDAC